VGLNCGINLFSHWMAQYGGLEVILFGGNSSHAYEFHRDQRKVYKKDKSFSIMLSIFIFRLFVFIFGDSVV
jgi:hypothetical protein